VDFLFSVSWAKVAKYDAVKQNLLIEKKQFGVE
jgi:hypothetical protein